MRALLPRVLLQTKVKLGSAVLDLEKPSTRGLRPGFQLYECGPFT